MWQVTYLANQIKSTFSIPIIRDTIAETPEEFFLKIVIGSPVDQHVTVGEPSRQRVLITGMLVEPYILIFMPPFNVYTHLELYIITNYCRR